jgi:hypothetical protein
MWKIRSQMTLLRIIKTDRIVLLVKIVGMLLVEETSSLSSLCSQPGNLHQVEKEDMRWTTSWMMVLSQLLQLTMELLQTMSITQ